MNDTEREKLKMATKQAQTDSAWIAEGMPDKAVSEKQFALLDKHGTPKDFALGCIAAIGEISILEAQQAAEKYKREWEAA
jgi:predicted MarR family transcription regulator